MTSRSFWVKRRRSAFVRDIEIPCRKRGSTDLDDGMIFLTPMVKVTQAEAADAVPHRGQPAAAGMRGVGDSMKRIAFLYTDEFHWSAPYLDVALSRLGAEITAKLFFIENEREVQDFPVEAEQLKPGMDCDQLVDKLLEWGADGVISLPMYDQETMRDAVVKDHLADRGIPMIMHRPEVIRMFSSKWDTKEVVRRFGIEASDGILIDGDLLNGRGPAVYGYPAYVRRRALELGFPLLVKPLWDCGANGICFIENELALINYLQDPYDGNAVLEQCLEGELCSVEIVGHDGSYVIQPLIWKGRTGSAPPFMASDRFRYCIPRREADDAFAPIAARLRTMCTTLGVEGVIEVEMIYVENTYRVIEINPRLSGTTTLSIAASDCDTYGCLVAMLLGNWTEEYARSGERRMRSAFQFPVLRLTDELVYALELDFGLVRTRSFTFRGREFHDVVVTCEFTETALLKSKLASLQSRFNLLTRALAAEADGVMTSSLTELPLFDVR
ncbi:ATP-grasp domain-containing protein [Nocardia sp. NPDC055049]